MADDDPHKDKALLTFIDGTWQDTTHDVVSKSQFNPALHPKLGFHEFKYYYANIIDYARVVMCVLAAFTISMNLPGFSAFLLMGSTLLDWVDGPVARMYNQCTMFGSGIDWLADVLSQVVTLAWWCTMDVSVMPWQTIATTIEIGCAIFDYASMVSGRYPKVEKGQNGFFLILQWTMPESSYTQFGTFLWLAYPIYCLASCLDLSYGEESLAVLKFTRYSMFVPAILYIWCEAAVLAHDILYWTEDGRRNMKKQLQQKQNAE